MATRPAVASEQIQAAEGDLVDVWFDARVRCSDDWAGSVAAIVCTERLPRVHHVVVRAVGHHHQEHLSAWEHVVAGDVHTMTLQITTAQLAEREQPMKTIHVSEGPVEVMDMEISSAWHFAEESEVFQMPVRVPDLDPGDVLLDRHIRVYSGNYHIGHLSGLRVGRDGGQATGVIIDIGHVWHHHHILIPAKCVTALNDAELIIRPG